MADRHVATSAAPGTDVDALSGGSSPLTTNGDLYVYAGGADARLAVGASGRFLRSDGTDPSWQTIAATDLPGVSATSVSLASSGAWTGDVHIGGNASVDTGSLHLDLQVATAGGGVYARIGRAPWAAPPTLDVRCRVKSFSSADASDSLQMLFGDALGATTTMGVQVRGTGAVTAFSDSGSPASAVTVASITGGQGWLRLVIQGTRATAYAGVGSGGAEPSSWTCVGHLQRGAGGRIAWPWINWQLNRGSSGSISATVDSIRSTEYPW